MKLNTICIKLHTQKHKNVKFGLLRFLKFFKNLKNLGFLKAIFQPRLIVAVRVAVKFSTHDALNFGVSEKLSENCGFD